MVLADCSFLPAKLLCGAFGKFANQQVAPWKCALNATKQRKRPFFPLVEKLMKDKHEGDYLNGLRDLACKLFQLENVPDSKLQAPVQGGFAGPSLSRGDRFFGQVNSHTVMDGGGYVEKKGSVAAS